VYIVSFITRTFRDAARSTVHKKHPSIWHSAIVHDDESENHYTFKKLKIKSPVDTLGADRVKRKDSHVTYDNESNTLVDKFVTHWSL
jgi:vacuolar-type H+-ATPase subunit E/Vma4